MKKNGGLGKQKLSGEMLYSVCLSGAYMCVHAFLCGYFC